MGLSIDWVARVQKAISRLALNINKPKDLITMPRRRTPLAKAKATGQDKITRVDSKTAKNQATKMDDESQSDRSVGGIR
jgi:hypothetical protein